MTTARKIIDATAGLIVPGLFSVGMACVGIITPGWVGALFFATGAGLTILWANVFARELADALYGPDLD